MSIFKDPYYEKYIKYKTKYIWLSTKLSELSKPLGHKTSSPDELEMIRKFSELEKSEKMEKLEKIDNTDKTEETYNTLDTLDDSINLNKTGGGSYFYEQNDIIKRTNMLIPKKFSKDIYQFKSIYLKANLINPQVRKKYSKIRKTILKNNSPPPHNYHLTLLILEINLNYPIIGNELSYMDKSSNKRKIRKDLSFLNQDDIKAEFELVFRNVVLTTMDYEMLGKLTRIQLGLNKLGKPTKKTKEINVGVKNPEMNDCVKYPGSYFVDHFEVNNKNLITTFRTKFYERMNDFMKQQYIKSGGKEKNYIGYRVDNETDPDYILIFYDNFSKDIPLLAIKKFYFGKNTWAPHISIFNMEELSMNNEKFLKSYVVEFLNNQDKEKTNTMVFDELKKSSVVRELLKKNAKPVLTIKDIDFELQT